MAPDYLLLSGLIVSISEEESFDCFAKSLERCLKGVRGSSKFYSKAWKVRLKNFLLQVTRSYALIPSTFRENLYQVVATPLGEEFVCCAGIEMNLDNIVHFRASPVASQWNSTGVNVKDTSPRTVAEQLTYFEARLHKQVGQLFKSILSLTFSASHHQSHYQYRNCHGEYHGMVESGNNARVNCAFKYPDKLL